MNKHTTDHASFVIDRNFMAPPDQVFATWADPAAKARARCWKSWSRS